jgi:hypothetical protein
VRSFPEFAVFACCALVALLAIVSTPREPPSGDPIQYHEDRLMWSQQVLDAPGPVRDFGRLGPERWALAGIAFAGVLWIPIRRGAAGRGLFRLAALAVLTGAVSAALGASSHLDRHLGGHMVLKYEPVARYLAGIRLGFGLAVLLVLASVLFRAREQAGGEA